MINLLFNHHTLIRHHKIKLSKLKNKHLTNLFHSRKLHELGNFSRTAVREPITNLGEQRMETPERAFVFLGDE
jgi:hypothetical protein